EKKDRQFFHWYTAVMSLKVATVPHPADAVKTPIPTTCPAGREAEPVVVVTPVDVGVALKSTVLEVRSFTPMVAFGEHPTGAVETAIINRLKVWAFVKV